MHRVYLLFQHCNAKKTTAKQSCTVGMKVCSMVLADTQSFHLITWVLQ